MKTSKEVSQYLTAQAEKLAFEAWVLIDRFDAGKNVTKESVKAIKDRAALLLANAQNNSEAKRLNKIIAGALFNLNCIA